jgi:hypothetical protein
MLAAMMAIAGPAAAWDVEGSVIEGKSVCRLSSSFGDGSRLAFDFDAEGFSLALGNDSWSLAVGKRYDEVIVVDGKAIATGALTAQSPTLLTTRFLYQATPQFWPAMTNGRLMLIQFRKVYFRVTLTGARDAFDKLRPCVLKLGEGRGPFS